VMDSTTNWPLNFVFDVSDITGWLNGWTNKYAVWKIWKYYSMVSSTDTWPSTYFSKAISTSVCMHTLL